MNFQTIIVLIAYFVAIYSSVYFILTWRSAKKKDPKPKRIPNVTIIIPTYNEEEEIESTINHCLNLDYPKNKLQVLVVNDGSTDRTREICEKFSKKGLVKLLNKKNTGKANSLNAALKKVKTEFFCVLDSDSYLKRNTLMKMVGYFNDENVGAVISSIDVREERGFLNRLQSLEYALVSFYRKVFSLDEAVYITHGAGCIFKTETVKKMGGFDEKNKTEDLEMALRLIKNGYKIKTSMYGSSVTSVPTTIKGFYKQRMRWYTGFLTNMFKYRRLLLNPNFGVIGLFSLPLNCFWVLISTYLLLVISYQVIWDVYNFLMSATYVGALYMVENASIYLIVTTVVVLSVITFLSFLPIYLTVVRKGNLLKNFIIYLIYIFVCSVINSGLYIIAFIKSLRGGAGWKKEE